MQEKIKVLQLGSPSGLYGAERWILSLMKYLDPTKIESYVGSIKDEANFKAPVCVEAEKLGFPAHIVEGSGKFSLSSVRNLRAHIKEHHIDILHTHGYKTDLVGWLATRGTRCKILSTPHGWTEKPGFKLGLYETIDRFAFPFFDAVAPLSKGIHEPLSRIPGLKTKLFFIRNGVDIGEIENSKEISKEMISLKNNHNHVIGYIGRLTHGKGLDTLFKAISEHSETNWKIALVGEGEQADELKSLAEKLDISDKINFYGFRPDRLSFLKGFDVFVLPSRSEGIPRCVMEAMSAEVPVVASDIPGCRNLIDGKTTGLLFELDNHKDLAQSIMRVANDPDLNESIKKNGKAFIQKNYSAARMAKEYEELFFNMIHN